MQNLISGLPRTPAGFGRHLAAIALIAFLAVAAPAEEAPAPVRSLLTPEEFHRAGLDKLSKGELDFLSACLARLHASPTLRSPASPVSQVEPPPKDVLSNPPAAPIKSLPQGEAAFGAEEQLHAAVEVIQAVPSAIRSRVLGPFEGWSGRTEFRLENGQVWKQAERGDFSANLSNPFVVIEKGLLGAFYLHVEGYGSRVRVKRVK
jgi:hypothetical protein